MSIGKKQTLALQWLDVGLAPNDGVAGRAKDGGLRSNQNSDPMARFGGPTMHLSLYPPPHMRLNCLYLIMKILALLTKSKY